MVSSSENIKPFENMLAGLLRSEPITPENGLEYARPGKAIADMGSILKSIADQEVQKKLKLME